MAQIAEAPGTAIPRASIRDYEGPLAEGLNIMNIPQITTNQKSPDGLPYIRAEEKLSAPSASPYAWLVAQWLIKQCSGYTGAASANRAEASALIHGLLSARRGGRP